MNKYLVLLLAICGGAVGYHYNIFNIQEGVQSITTLFTNGFTSFMNMLTNNPASAVTGAVAASAPILTVSKLLYDRYKDSATKQLRGLNQDLINEQKTTFDLKTEAATKITALETQLKTYADQPNLLIEAQQLVTVEREKNQKLLIQIDTLHKALQMNLDKTILEKVVVK